MHSDTCSFQQAFECMQHRTGVVIPVYFPEGIDRAQGAALLRDNVGWPDYLPPYCHLRNN